MRCPPFGLCVPVTFHRARDVDTIEVQLPNSDRIWAIRLVDTWGPELKRGAEELRAIAAEGKGWVTQYLEGADRDLRLGLGLPLTQNLLASLTFDRLPGTIWIGAGHTTLNRMIIERGYASTTKGGRLGE